MSWVFLLALAASDGGWKVIGHADGVTTSVLEDKGGGVPRARGEIEIAAELFDILAVLNDVARSCEWMPNCGEARLIRNLNDYSSLIYLRTASPWPVADRDAVIRTRVWIRPDGDAARAEFNGIQLAEVPPVDGVVRMKTSEGSYLLERIDASRTRVRYELYSDPGGSVPTSLASRAVTQVPHDTLVALARRARQTRGQYPAFRDKYDPRKHKSD